MKCLKFALFGFNLVIWLGGCIMLVIGAWLLLEPSNGHLLNLFVENATPEETVHLVAYSLLGLSAIDLIIGLFGCRASMRGNQCVLGMYTSMLITLITTELAVMAIGGFMTYRTLSSLEVRLHNRLTEYGHDPTSDIPFSHSLDFAQYKFNCCGIHGDSDYNGTAWWRHGQYSGARRQVPLTCCVLKNPEPRKLVQKMFETKPIMRCALKATDKGPLSSQARVAVAPQRGMTSEEAKNAGSPMSVVTRVFHHKDNEKPWLHPQPRDDAACQVSDPEGQEGFRHKEGCLEKMTNWLRAESLKLVVLTLLIAAFQTCGVISSALLCRSIRDVQQE